MGLLCFLMPKEVCVWRAVYQATRIIFVVVSTCSTGRAFRSTDNFSKFVDVHEKGQISVLCSIQRKSTSPSLCSRMAAMSWNVLTKRGLSVGLKLRCYFSIWCKGSIRSVNIIHSIWMCDRKEGFVFGKIICYFHRTAIYHWVTQIFSCGTSIQNRPSGSTQSTLYLG